MSQAAIEIDRLGKRYRIGKQAVRRNGPAVFTHAVASPFRYLLSSLREPAADEAVWALRNATFEVAHGEVVGIIGRNGAGKSTLLKILSRITEPTEGRAVINGRVGSLLEVGTGFHPELTGRENIYLSGAIMGMKRREIDRKLDEIVAFADIARFLDTPVKRFSSGMYVRLAFAVAAHLEPEILLVDEVLAVGDTAFQKKCLGKIGDVAREGRTVLFVSHNMAAVLDLCQTVHWLDRGMLADTGAPLRVVQNYLSFGQASSEIDLVNHAGRRAGSKQAMAKARLLSNGVPAASFRSGDPFELEVEVTCGDATFPELSLGFILKDGVGFNLFATNMAQYGQAVENAEGCVTLRMSMDQLPLSPGAYGLSLFLGNGTYDIDAVENAIQFDVLWNPELNLSFPQPHWGPLYVSVKWTATRLPGA